METVKKEAKAKRRQERVRKEEGERERRYRVEIPRLKLKDGRRGVRGRLWFRNDGVCLS